MTPTRLRSLDKEEVLNFLYLRIGISGTRLSRKLRQRLWGRGGNEKSCVEAQCMFYARVIISRKPIIIVVAYSNNNLLVKLMSCNKERHTSFYPDVLTIDVNDAFS